MFEKPSTWNYKEALCMAELPKLAKEAQKLAEIIDSVYPAMLELSESERIEVTFDMTTAEYLTRGKAWEIRRHEYNPNAQSTPQYTLLYSVECTPEGIFEYLKKRFMISNGFWDENCFLDKANFMAKADMFQRFINRTKDYAILESTYRSVFKVPSVVKTIPVDD